MSVRDGRLGEARRRTLRALRELGLAMRSARLAAGLTQAEAAREIGISRAYFGRIERGEVRDVGFRLANRICAVLGLDLVVRAYRSGPPVRDAPHLALLARFDEQISSAFRTRNEAPIGSGPDRRAWDRLLEGPVSIGVEAETRIDDVQALERKMTLKQRDSGVRRMLLVVRGSRHNRMVLRAARPMLRATFPLATREVLEAVRAGTDPGANGVAIL